MSSENFSNKEFTHVPVMLTEIVEQTKEISEGYFLDATLGGAGHSKAILEANSNLRIIGVDRDPVALEAARSNLLEFADRAELVNARFDQLTEILDGKELSGFLFDLGVSSPQLDFAERGFSYNQDGPLDMRMCQADELSAGTIINDYSFEELRRIIQINSNERFASRIAKAIVASRPIEGTVALSEIVVGAIPAAARRTGGHPAKRTFQAIRIAVNDELSILAPAIEAALDYLEVGGKGLVLTYHSGEDKIVKSIFSTCSRSTDPPGLPELVDIPKFELPRPIALTPSSSEISKNRRASSARLRTIIKRAA